MIKFLKYIFPDWTYWPLIIFTLFFSVVVAIDIHKSGFSLVQLYYLFIFIPVWVGIYISYKKNN